MLMSPLSKCFFGNCSIVSIFSRSFANHVLETTEDLGLSQTWKIISNINENWELNERSWEVFKMLRKVLGWDLLENVSCKCVEGCEESRPEGALARLENKYIIFAPQSPPNYIFSTISSPPGLTEALIVNQTHRPNGRCRPRWWPRPPRGCSTTSSSGCATPPSSSGSSPSSASTSCSTSSWRCWCGSCLPQWSRPAPH